MARLRLRMVSVAVAGTLLLAACGSTSGAGGTGGSGGGSSTATGSLVFGVFNPFSGADASFGPEQNAGCVPAAQAITAAGGILGHKTVSCIVADSRGDPADAVPAAEQLIASHSNLVGLLGPSSDEAAATVPLFNRAHIPMFGDTGQALFNKSTSKYFWRITPPDDAVGLAMALYAHRQGYTRAAGVFGTDISSQGTAPTVESGYQKSGGTLTAVKNVALGQPSYRSEVTALAAGHPQALFIEADPQTSATILSEFTQLYHGIPIVGTDGTTQPPWQKAVTQAIGQATMTKYYRGAQPFAPTSGAAHTIWLQQLHGAAAKVSHPISQWENDSFAEAAWDSVNLMALAMEMAHSTTPSVYNPYITKVANGGPGATVVHSFAAGKAAILAHKAITYAGATGPITFDQYQNSPGAFEIVRADGSTITTYTSKNLQGLG
ncbi:MAG TPA: ABC transporter substrate-binding protein [Solirubrobacteraceae bacterium]|nr:ABC transporter substrate-binding protein [Solirubrobacteraceae bacterium]